ncbi:TBC1 domain family member 12 isoform X2, partial [Silurus asotus]
IFTLYSKPLPLDVACRVWDLFCRDGEEALFRTALGILRLYQDVLLQMDFIHSAQFLSRLPQNTPAHLLFIGIANTDMLSNNGRWNQSSHESHESLTLTCFSVVPLRNTFGFFMVEREVLEDQFKNSRFYR